MARKGFFSRIATSVKNVFAPSPERRERKQAKKEAKRERKIAKREQKILKKTAKKLGTEIPPKPEIPPHPGTAPSSELSVADRVARYKAMNPVRRSVLRPQDEESMFWRLYDEMGV